MPAEWLPEHADSWKLPTEVRGPDPAGGAYFDDDEWDSFLASVKGA